MQNSVRRHLIEAEAAIQIEQIMRREFGLSPVTATADLCGNALSITLTKAISPLGRAIAQVQGGRTVLANVYTILHDVNQDQMHSIVSHIVGVPVAQSLIEADLLTSDVFVIFYLTDWSLTEFGCVSAIEFM